MPGAFFQTRDSWLNFGFPSASGQHWTSSPFTLTLRAMQFLITLAVAALLSGSTVSASAQGANCLGPPYETPSSPDQELIAQIYAEIMPVLGTVLFSPQPSGDGTPTICLVKIADDAHGVFDATTKNVLLERGLSDGLLAGILLHELRHADQFNRGFCPSNDVSMEENARGVAAMEADASATSLMAAWELRQKGRPAAWNALALWDTQKDIAEAFSREMSRSGDTSLAVSAAFSQWYASEYRTESYYIASCSDYLDRQDTEHLLPSYDLLPGDFLDNLCTLPDGSVYPCEDSDWTALSR